MFGVNTRTLGLIENYNEAVAREAAIKPIRGRSTTIKPLGARRQDYINIRKEAGENGGEPKIVVRMYRTDIITFHPNNTIEIQPYNSQSTNAVLSSVLGVSFFSQHGRQWVACAWERAEGAEKETGEAGEKKLGRGYLPLKTNTLFRRANADSLQLHTAKPPVFPVVHKINKREMRAVRSRYKDFINYAVGILKLRDGVGFSYEDRSIAQNDHEGLIKLWPTTEQQLAWIDPDANQTDTGGYYKALNFLCGAKDTRCVWNAATLKYEYIPTPVTRTDVVKGINKLILSVPDLRSRVLVPITKTDGKLVGDRYG